MQSEFGRIPPAFLPVGAAYLFQHQMRHLDGRLRKWLSLPFDFQVSEAQQRILAEENVQTIRVDPKISLGMSVFQSILEIDPGGPIEIVHGDTLVEAPEPGEQDVFSIAEVAEQYKWGLVEVNRGRVSSVRDVDRSDFLTEEMLMISGYFGLNDTWRFIKCLVRAGFDFVAALDEYASDGAVVADRSIRTFDFGHQKTFYSSRKYLAATRHFNSLQVDDYVVKKESDERRKLDAEANWLRSVPPDLQPFTARLIEGSSTQTSGLYTTLYSSFPTVAELYLAQSSRFVWLKVLGSCIEFLNRAYRHTAEDQASTFSWLVIDKLKSRIEQYPNFLPSIDDPLKINGAPVGSLSSIVGQLEAIVREAPDLKPCIMHGDFCFSNMLFDPRSDRIVLIDPRGLVADQVTIYGDIRYDIAKLGHSIIGRYDQIVGGHLVAESHGSGEFSLAVPRDPLRDWLEEQFLSASIDSVSFSDAVVHAAIVSLFLAMLPLHSDDSGRQVTLFANGLRLFNAYFS
jgi:hypothetical protein